MHANDNISPDAGCPDRAAVLRRAEHLTCGDRNASYGAPTVNMADTAALWSAFLGTPVTGAQVAVCMALVKAARLRASPDHFDSHVDAAAYMAIAYECAASREDKLASFSTRDGALDYGVEEPEYGVCKHEFGKGIRLSSGARLRTCLKCGALSAKDA